MKKDEEKVAIAHNVTFISLLVRPDGTTYIGIVSGP